MDWEIHKNISLASMEKVSRYGLLRTHVECAMAQTLSQKVGVKAVSVFDKVGQLSGDNQQKVVFAKFLAQDLQVLILDEPTKGIDVAAKQAIYHIINELTVAGYALIVISSEMPEVLGMADRIAVMCEGHLVQTFVNDGSITQEMILGAAMSREKA